MVDGGEVTDEQVAPLRWPQGISQDLEDAANEVGFRLKLFVGDDDIRSRDPAYDGDMRRDMASYLAFLKEMVASEDERRVTGRRVHVRRSPIIFRLRTAIIVGLVLVFGVIWLIS